MAELFGLASNDSEGTETEVSMDDITSIINQLTAVVNASNAARQASESTAQSAALTGASVRKTNAEIKIEAARQALATLAQQFQQKFDVQGLNLKREDMRLKQATTQEDLTTSGQKRYQSSVLFQQAQQDRKKKSTYSKAMAKGIAEGLAHRSGQTLLGQQNINQQVLPSLAGGVQ